MPRYRGTLKISTGHAGNSRPDDWTEISISRTLEAADRREAILGIGGMYDYARSELDLGRFIDAQDSRVIADAYLIG